MTDLVPLAPADQLLVVNVAHAVCTYHDDWVRKPCPRCLQVVRESVIAFRAACCD
jgi:hypothetical protein